MPTQEHRTRDETRQLIIQAIQRSDVPLTRTQIARELNRRKTPHLNALVDELVAEGLLVREVKVFHNGVQGYVYYLAEY